MEIVGNAPSVPILIFKDNITLSCAREVVIEIDDANALARTQLNYQVVAVTAHGNDIAVIYVQLNDTWVIKVDGFFRNIMRLTAGLIRDLRNHGISLLLTCL